MVLDLHLQLILRFEGHTSALWVFFFKTCHDGHQCFDGVPCRRDQWVLVGAVDSISQGQQWRRITVSSIKIHTETVVDISMHTRGAKVMPCKHPQSKNISVSFAPFLFLSSIFPVDPPSSPTSCQTRMHLSTPRTQSSV